jgi:glutamate--cysteine ligase
MDNFKTLLSNKDQLTAHITLSKRGIEREALRVNKSGKLSNIQHPSSLGHPLTHPYITTDFAESQLELITGVYDNIHDCLANLTHNHLWVANQLAQLKDSEYLWPASMPGDLSNTEPKLAYYGKSNLSKLKHTYRRGLANRYGKKTQLISGIHYNFSFSDKFWRWYQTYLQELNLSERLYKSTNLQEFKTASYLHMIRNFYRYGGVLPYLFGVSSTCDDSLIANAGHTLPYATSMRLGNSGYTNKYNGWVNANNLESYLKELHTLTSSYCPEYSHIEIQDKCGKYQQLSKSILQIENEDYSIIRPKRSGNWLVRPIERIATDGIEYLEVRAIDVNPWCAIGIDSTQAHTIECLLTYCLLEDSPAMNSHEQITHQENFINIASKGRDLQLKLNIDSAHLSLNVWLSSLYDKLKITAHLMGMVYLDNINKQYNKLRNINFIPATILIRQIEEQQLSYHQFMTNLISLHHNYFTNKSNNTNSEIDFEEIAKESYNKAKDFKDSDDFKDFLTQYMLLYKP